MRILSEQTRKVWKRRAKNFWFEYSHNKIGLVGLAILVLFILTAIFSPWIAPYSIDEVRGEAPKQADRFAIPDWVALISPQARDLPPQMDYDMNWSVTNPDQIPASVIIEEAANASVRLYYNASVTGDRNPVAITLAIEPPIHYPYSPMHSFLITFHCKIKPDHIIEIYRIIGGRKWLMKEIGSIEYKLELFLETPSGFSYPLWDQNWYQERYTNPQAKPEFWNKPYDLLVEIPSALGELAVKLGYERAETSKMVADMFSQKGDYKFYLQITLQPPADVSLENATGSVIIDQGIFTVMGLRFGLLGTDGYGHDVFSEIVHGSGISLAIGISAAIIGVSFGVLVGVTSGYIGGLVDEGLMRVVDILLCLPVLPLLLAMSVIFGYNVWYIVFLIAIFGWQGLSRTIRSQVLSIKEMAFIECAISSGGTKSYVILRHVVPNVLPIALASLVLSVPGAIITEAALSFLGFGDPLAPTWGKILYYARETGGFSPQYMAWWVILPPGLAITFLCLAFVFIGHAIDEIVNPKLRRRR